MKKKLIISESQKEMLSQYITESSLHQSTVKKIVTELERNYKKAVETYRDGNEYKQRKVFEVVADGELIPPKALLEYLKGKYNVSEAFLKQVIEDWCDGNAKNGMLSKNVGLN